MKEGVYKQVTTILNDYGKIVVTCFGGGWQGQIVNSVLEKAFWEPGKYQSPKKVSQVVNLFDGKQLRWTKN